MQELKNKQKVYYARIIETSGIYDVYDLTIRTVEKDWFVGIEKRDKHAYLFPMNAINKNVFLNRDDAVSAVRLAESMRKISTNEEIYYEEY